MNARDVMKYGNLTVLRAVRNLPEADWLTGGVCGHWSVKEIIAHLASFEHVLVEVMTIADGGEMGPYSREMMADGQAFNDRQVPARAGLSVAETLAEYEATHAETMRRAAALPDDKLRVTGFFPPYGDEYDLEDFIAYSFYGHKREHCAQIAVFRDQIRR
jgi:uncharacterized protein (TIGR03083 family)